MPFMANWFLVPSPNKTSLFKTTSRSQQSIFSNFLSRCQSLPPRRVHVCQPQVLGLQLRVRWWRRLRRRQRRAQVRLTADLRAQPPALQHLRVCATDVELRRRPRLLWQLRRGARALRRRWRPLPAQPKGQLHHWRIPLRQRGVREADVEVRRRPRLQGQIWRVRLPWVVWLVWFVAPRRDESVDCQPESVWMENVRRKVWFSWIVKLWNVDELRILHEFACCMFRNCAASPAWLRTACRCLCFFTLWLQLRGSSLLSASQNLSGQIWSGNFVAVLFLDVQCLAAKKNHPLTIRPQ